MKVEQDKINNKREGQDNDGHSLHPDAGQYKRRGAPRAPRKLLRNVITQLQAIFGAGAGAILLAEENWASITFEGWRITIRMEPGPDISEQSWQKALNDLPETEITLDRYFVADAVHKKTYHHLDPDCAQRHPNNAHDQVSNTQKDRKNSDSMGAGPIGDNSVGMALPEIIELLIIHDPVAAA